MQHSAFTLRQGQLSQSPQAALTRHGWREKHVHEPAISRGLASIGLRTLAIAKSALTASLLQRLLGHGGAEIIRVLGQRNE